MLKLDADFSVVQSLQTFGHEQRIASFLPPSTMARRILLSSEADSVVDAMEVDSDASTATGRARRVTRAPDRNNTENFILTKQSKPSDSRQKLPPLEEGVEPDKLGFANDNNANRVRSRLDDDSGATTRSKKPAATLKQGTVKPKKRNEPVRQCDARYPSADYEAPPEHESPSKTASKARRPNNPPKSTNAKDTRSLAATTVEGLGTHEQVDEGRASRKAEDARAKLQALKDAAEKARREYELLLERECEQQEMSDEEMLEENEQGKHH